MSTDGAWSRSRNRRVVPAPTRRRDKPRHSTKENHSEGGTTMRFSITRGVLIVTAALVAFACGNQGGGKGAAAKPSGRMRIGLLMDTLGHERWQRDRDLFVERAKERRAEVLVEAAEGDTARQAQLADKLLAEGVKVLVVVPHDTEKAA